jgi:hypothetical protein
LDSDEWRGALQIENTPGDLLEFGNKRIDARRFSIELGKPTAHLAHVSD